MKTEFERLVQAEIDRLGQPDITHRPPVESFRSSVGVAADSAIFCAVLKLAEWINVSPSAITVHPFVPVEVYYTHTHVGYTTVKGYLLKIGVRGGLDATGLPTDFITADSGMIISTREELIRYVAKKEYWKKKEK